LFKFLDAIIAEHKERKLNDDEGKLQEDLIHVLLRIRSQGSSQSFLTMGTIKAVIFVSSVFLAAILHIHILKMKKKQHTHKVQSFDGLTCKLNAGSFLSGD
jgi:hypothetical protein